MLYDIIPLFNKFRTPNSALGVVAFMMPILGILALNDVLKGNVSKDEILKALYISGGTMAALCLFYALALPRYRQCARIGYRPRPNGA